MEQNNTPSHDAIDAFVANVLGWYERHFTPAPAPATGELSFSDEWERRQLARDLRWN